MSEKRRLIDDFSANLVAYRENFVKFLQCVVRQFDADGHFHENQIEEIVLEIIKTDMDLRRNKKRFDACRKRQREIAKLESKLAKLSTKVNIFTKVVARHQGDLSNLISRAEKLQKGIAQENPFSTIGNILETARIVGPAASGAPRNSLSFPWMPDSYQMEKSLLAPNSLNVAAPAVASNTVSFDPVIMTRNAVIQENFSDSGSYDYSDSD